MDREVERRLFIKGACLDLLKFAIIGGIIIQSLQFLNIYHEYTFKKEELIMTSRLSKEIRENMERYSKFSKLEKEQQEQEETELQERARSGRVCCYTQEFYDHRPYEKEDI